MKKRLSMSFCFACLFVLAGCGGGSTAMSPLTPLMITSTAAPAGSGDKAYSFPLTASGGVVPYKWNWAAATDSSLPPGLTLSNNAISGIATTTGSYNVIVAVTDSGSPASQSSANYTINIDTPSTSYLTITSVTPPTGTVGAQYQMPGETVSCVEGTLDCMCIPQLRPVGLVCQRRLPGTNGFNLTASGGAPGYIWSWEPATGSSLPPGLYLTGSTILGIPSVAGSFAVVISVSDSSTPAEQASTILIIDVSQ